MRRKVIIQCCGCCLKLSLTIVSCFLRFLFLSLFSLLSLFFFFNRTGVTPDSQGQEVYYYVVSNRAPFTLGCFGPINTEAECRALYPECDGVAESFTTAHGTDDYDLDCPCFNPVTGGNMPGQGKPKFLGPNGFDAFQLDLMEGERSCNDKDGNSHPCSEEEKAAVAALYSSQKCGSGGNAPSPAENNDDGVVRPSGSAFCGSGTKWIAGADVCVASFDAVSLNQVGAGWKIKRISSCGDD